jgi:hypothetical protein
LVSPRTESSLFFTVRKRGTNQSKNDNTWNIGESLVYPGYNLSFPKVESTIIDKKSNSVVWWGILKPGGIYTIYLLLFIILAYLIWSVWSKRFQSVSCEEIVRVEPVGLLVSPHEIYELLCQQAFILF